MEWFVATLIYIGGVWSATDDTGFWKSVFWPYWLGKKLMAWTFEGEEK